MRRTALIAFTTALLASTAPVLAQPQSNSGGQLPACRRGAGDDRCIQLYERGVRREAVRTAAVAAGLPGERAPARNPNQPRYGTFGIDLAARDLAVKPGDDFNAYANGTWLRAVEIPADRTQWSLWTSLSEEIEQQLKTIVDDAQSGRIATPVARQVGGFYAAWMDEAGIERRGIAPLRPYLDRVAAVNDRAGLLTLFATPGYISPVGVGITVDPMDSNRYAVGASQSGLGLPNRDYYLREGADYDRYRAGYRAFIIELHRLAGIADGAAKADAIIALERQIAEAHWAPERLRDPRATYNPMDRAQLAALAPQIDWPAYLAARRLPDAQTVIVRTPSAVTGAAALLDSVPLQTWKDYLTFHLIRSNAQFLPRAYDDAQFAFYGRTLSGQETQRERWKRGLSLLNGTMGEAVGEIYAARHFPAESRRQMDELIVNLRAAFTERLTNLEWMDAQTRTEALRKLEAFEPRIGHPEEWIDYSALRIDPADPVGNFMRAQEFGWNLQLSRYPNPVDRGLWGMNAQTINASYNPLLNQITFPAGILQPPFFDPKADPAVNYGAIGAVIGHEIGHGFDDSGRRFDGSGRLRDWWSEASGERFGQRSGRLGEQYGSYEPLPGLRINPQLTMGENIGDLGGLEMAYAAYRRHVAQHGEPAVINGVTGDQRFFLAWAQVWRSKSRDDSERAAVLTDPHSADQFRINGVVRNMDAWYRAFNVQPGDRMYLPPDQRVSIW
jgi:putative endopeptidase